MFTAAAAFAPQLFRASPIDPILRDSPSLSQSEDRYSNTTPIGSEQRIPSPLPGLTTPAQDISRASSTSTQTSNAAFLQQHQSGGSFQDSPLLQRHNSYSQSLPGLSALASLASAPPPHLVRAFSSNGSPSMNFASAPAPAPTPGLSGNAPPVCQNCQTSTTPLWRRDEAGSVLCNACGLFLKLHGRPRPISLKTDVIKSRNRVKSANQGPKKKFETNGLPASLSLPALPPDFATPHNGASQHRRVSQMASSGTSDRSHSPVSRTATPTIHDPNIAPQHMFDGVTLNDHAFQNSPSLPGLHLNHTSPGSTSSMADRHLEPPLTYEQLLLTNAQLRTRVNEQELVAIMTRESEETMRTQRDAALRNEEALKARIAQLEQQLQRQAEDDRPSKKMRMSDVTTSE